MTLSDIRQALDATVLWGGDRLEREVACFYWKEPVTGWRR